MSDLIKSARLFASESRDRFSSGRNPALQNPPSHLKSVAQIVSTVTEDEETIAAAWLHDIVEDTAVTLGNLERKFGKGVARLVSDITVPSHSGYRSRVSRFALAKMHLARASAAAKTIKIADLIDTCSDLHKHNPIALVAYASEANELAAVLEGGEPRLLARLRRNLEKYAFDSLPAPSTPTPTRFRPMAIPLATLRVFEHAVLAQYVAEPLVSFHSDHDGAEILEAMTLSGVEVAGLHRNDELWGYVEAATLRERSTGAVGTEFAPSQVVNARSSLAEVIDVLTRHDRCFVSAGKKVIGVISLSDLHKPAVRMWLFGIITVTELEITERIRQVWPDESWNSLVSEQRLNKARELHAERQRRKDYCQLLDCLQLSDKIAILTSNPAELAALGYSSASGAQKAGKQIESLRNKVAHSQDFVEQDWPQVVRLARHIHEILDES